MGRVSKSLCLLLVVILVPTSLLAIQSSYAQSIAKPPIPQFTTKFVDSSYDVPTTTSIDPYTGQKVTNQGYHVDNRTIILTIDNQPYHSYVESGQFVYYNVRTKGNFEENWTTVYTVNRAFLLMSKLPYTVASYSLKGFPFSNDLPNGGFLDFQVIGMVGGVYRKSSHFSSGYEFIGQTSDWSNTQTINIPAAGSSPNPSPTVPELSWLALLPLCLIVASVALVLKRRRKI